MNFYDELIKEIRKMITEDRLEEAKKRIYEELAIAYVPGAVLEELTSLLDEIDQNEDRELEHLSSSKIRAYLLSDDRRKQLRAANELNRLNVRDYLDLIHSFLGSADGDAEVKTMVVATLIDQEISEEFKLLKGGMEYDFIPRFVMKVEDSDGYQAAKAYFDKYLFKNPTYFHLALDLFSKEAYHALPLNIDSDEATIMADNIIRHIFRLFDDETALKDYKDQRGEDVVMH